MRKTENLHTEEVAHRKIATTMHTKFENLLGLGRGRHCIFCA